MPPWMLGNQSIDHIAATVTVDWMPTTHRGRGPHHTWDRDKIRLADEATWEAFFSDWPSIPWGTDLTTHMAKIEDHLHQKLHDFFPRDAKKRRLSCFDDEICDFMTQKNRLKKVLCNSKRQCERHQLHTALLSWRRRCTCYVYFALRGDGCATKLLAFESSRRSSQHALIGYNDR